MENFGGITLDEVIVFQTQIMMGAQFGRIKKEKAMQEDIIIACLRMGWNDAFRHTSENTKKEEHNKKKKDCPSILELSEKEWRTKKEHFEDYDDFICGNILNQKIVLDTFKGFVCSQKTAAKIDCINNNFTGLKTLFQKYKNTDGDKQLCFGHFQKMFNIAIKLYICLYICRGHLKIDDVLFDEKIIENIKYADCPIDSIILEKLSIETGQNYTTHKWSKYGTPNHPTQNYNEVQTSISKIDKIQGKCNLYYDFSAWKQF